jgi:tetratricopeptide (TPR) repeat protein
MAKQDKVVIELLQVAATSLLKAMSKQEHEISKCSQKVRNLMDEGVNLARSGELDRATEKFYKAADIDPKFVGARIQLIKAYQAHDRDLEALVMGGFALSVASDAKSRCRIFNFMGQISQELFKNTQSQSHALQAISFFERARSSDTQDILPIWNLVDIHVLSHINKFISTDNSQHIDKAKQNFRALLDMARNSQGNTVQYLPAIISEAKAKLLNLNDDWWSSQLLELENCTTSQAWREDLNVKTFSYGKLAKAVALAAVMSSLAYTTSQLSSGFDSKAQPPTLAPSQQKTAAPPSKHSNNISLYKLEHEQLAAIGHNWGDVKFVALDHDWGDLGTNKFT